VALVAPALAGRAIRAGLLATAVFYCAMASFFIVLALYLQEGRGMSALSSGAMFTAVGAGYLAASLVPARLTARLGLQADRPGAEDRDGAGRLDLGEFRGVPAGDEGVGEHDEVVFLVVTGLPGHRDAVGVGERGPAAGRPVPPGSSPCRRSRRPRRTHLAGPAGRPPSNRGRS